MPGSAYRCTSEGLSGRKNSATRVSVNTLSEMLEILRAIGDHPDIGMVPLVARTGVGHFREPDQARHVFAPSVEAHSAAVRTSTAGRTRVRETVVGQ